MPKSHTFTVLFVTDQSGEKLVHLRSTLAPLKWDGDWAIGKPSWTNEIKKAIGENYLHGDEGNFNLHGDLKLDGTAKADSLK